MKPYPPESKGQRWVDLIEMGLRSLAKNKLRSALMVLSIIIGVAADILLMNLISGTGVMVENKVYGLGADTFQVTKSPIVITSLKQYVETLRRKDLTLQNCYDALNSCAHCAAVGAVGTRSDSLIVFQHQSTTNTEVRGWTPEVQEIYNLELIAGRPLVAADMDRRGQVAIIGYDLYSTLFAGMDPIDRQIRIDGSLYRVIGVGRKEGSYMGKDRDNWVAIPLSAWQAKYGFRQPLIIWVKSGGAGARFETAIDEVRTVLRGSRHQSAEGPDSFEISTNASVNSLWTNLSGGFSLALIAITSLSVVIGGVMIMNTMLISVTERTQEVGLRKAVGASKSDIFRQFLTEAFLLALTGSIAGVFLGQTLWLGLASLIGVPAVFTTGPIFVGVSVATVVGILFGVLPARKAAGMDPASALKSEV